MSVKYHLVRIYTLIKLVAVIYQCLFKLGSYTLCCSLVVSRAFYRHQHSGVILDGE